MLEFRNRGFFLFFSKVICFRYKPFHFLFGFPFSFSFFLGGKFRWFIVFVEDFVFTYLFCVKSVISMEVFMVSAFSADNKGKELKGFL